MVVARVEGASSSMLGCPVMGVSGRKWPVVLAWVEGLSIMVFGGFAVVRIISLLRLLHGYIDKKWAGFL